MSITKGLDEMVDTAISINREVLASVARAGGAQSFVSTSSRVAAFNPDESSREKVKVTEDDWFEEASNLALKTENSGLRSLLTCEFRLVDLRLFFLDERVLTSCHLTHDS